MAEPSRSRRCSWCASGLILVTGGASAAEPNQSFVRRPWRKGVTQAPAPAAPEAADSASSAEPLAVDPGFARQGFFTRLALGSGVFLAGSGSAADSRSFLGLPVSFEAFFGGTPSAHVSVGAGYARDAVGRLSSKDQKVDGDEPRLADTSFYLEQLAGFLELYPDRSSPYYGLATLGLGTLNVRRRGDELELPLFHWLDHLAGADPSGVILTLGGGYETWLDERWALGVSGRLLAALLTSSEVEPGTDVTVIMPSLLLTLSYH